ncbi:MAG: acyltransferase family protein [Sporichthyaceae bacterium]
MDTTLQRGTGARTGLIPGQRRGGPAPVATHSDRHRPDIQALRALAVSLVVVYHLWPASLPGGYVGVDVFFVISGFLITSQLLALRPTTARDLASFWAKRVRRLLPAALTVLLVVLLVSRFVGPTGRWSGNAAAVAASVLNVQNWWLAQRQIDYLAQFDYPSPVQHFWSLAVEEQFYLFWPLVLMGCALVAARRRRSFAAIALGTLAVLVAASFVFAVQGSRGPQADVAFFHTGTRIWELGAGALLAALLLHRPSSTWMLRNPWVACLGLATIAIAALAYSGSTPWPGFYALLPVLGTVLVIAACTPTSSLLGRAMALRPIQAIGDLSYSIYLWHWPLLVMVPMVAGRNLKLSDTPLILAATIVLAWLSKRFVEDPARRWRPTAPSWRPIAVGLAASVLLLGLVGFQVKEARAREAVAAAQLTAVRNDPGACFGAAVRTPKSACPPAPTASIVPDPAIARRDLPSDWNCKVDSPWTTVRECTFGPANATKNIALVGNSVALQWTPALADLADRNGWRVTTFLATNCEATAHGNTMSTPALREACSSWGRRAMEQTLTRPFDLVIASDKALTPEGYAASRAHGGAGYSEAVAGYRDYLRQWVAAKLPVLVLRSTPLAAATVPNVPDCVSRHLGNLAACGGDRAAWVQADPLAEAAAALKSRSVRVADLTPVLCDERCAPVIGGALVYSDSSHVTATYMRTMAPFLDPHVKAALKRK